MSTPQNTKKTPGEIQEIYRTFESRILPGMSPEDRALTESYLYLKRQEWETQAVLQDRREYDGGESYAELERQRRAAPPSGGYSRGSHWGDSY